MEGLISTTLKPVPKKGEQIMRSGFRLGKIFGIEVQIDWSWLLIFLLISWNWSTALGTMHSDWAIVLRWVVAVAAALLFFLSVLAHELAHSLVATSRGIPVSHIRLHLFGGVANLQREPDSAGGEFVMAIIGPVTSLVIGGTLLLITGLTTGLDNLSARSMQQMLTGLSPTATILVWLGSVNLVLGLFNLIPGFPLDGGRVLRSILWAITGNLRLATRWATAVGRAIAWLMIITGIATAFGYPIPLLGEGVVNGLWLAFIGWFLHNASIQSYQQMIIREALEDIPVASVMRRDPPTVPYDRSVASFVHDFIMKSDDQGFPVVDQGDLVGIATLEDVRSTPQEAWETTSVWEIMTPAAELVTLAPDDDAVKALEILAGRDIRQIPVIREGRLEGLVRRRDLVRWLQLQTGTEGSRGRNAI